MNNVDFRNVNITGGFWREKQTLISKKTLFAVYNRFVETGRFNAFRCDWVEGKENKPHYFWDSDVAKWIEGASYILEKKRDKKLEKIIDDTVSLIEKNQDKDGYFNIYFTVVDPESRFKYREKHELYCAGHLFEASIAYYKATKKRKFLDLMIKYADYIYQRFYVKRDTGFTTPGHEEIELALIKLYEITNDEKYLNLSKFFIDERGKENETYTQSHIEVKKQNKAIGHSVRAMYLYSGMADVALYTKDEELKNACKSLFDDVVNKKMYITGGIGSSSCGEAFTVDYDLPNIVAYTETCASIGLAFFAHRMMNLDFDSKYADVIERVIYNGFLSSTSLDGESFFYENPLEVIPYLQTRDKDNIGNGKPIHFPINNRQKVFSCSCCPPNIVRFVPSIGNYIYSYDNSCIYVNQFMQSTAKVKIGDKEIKITQTTSYPKNGKVKIKIEGGDCKVGIRIPSYCKKEFEKVNGYTFFSIKDGETVNIDFGMDIQIIEAKKDVILDCGKYALMRGPVVYCMEGVDNLDHLRELYIDPKSKFKLSDSYDNLLPNIEANAYHRNQNINAPLYSVMESRMEKCKVTFIPYYAFANRGDSEMLVWFNIKV